MGKDQGFKVPENYFEEFNKKMMDSLPDIEIKEEKSVETQVIDKPSMWVRVRPYVYMAASIAGIFCMMTVLNNFNGTNAKTPSEMAKEIKSNNATQEAVENEKAGDNATVTYEDSVKRNIEVNSVAK